MCWRCENLEPSSLSSHMTQWRPGQLEAIERAYHSKAKYICIDAPVGIGKSGIVTSLAKLYAESDVRSAVLTQKKSLQDQYIQDFEWVKLIKGQRNYPCVSRDYKDFDMVVDKFDPTDASNIWDSAKACNIVMDCPDRRRLCYYRHVRQEAIDSSVICTNYAYLSAAWRFRNPVKKSYREADGTEVTYLSGGNALQRRSVLFLDEAHGAESWFRPHIKLTKRDIDIVNDHAKLLRTYPCSVPNNDFNMDVRQVRSLLEHMLSITLAYDELHPMCEVVGHQHNKLFTNEDEDNDSGKSNCVLTTTRIQQALWIMNDDLCVITYDPRRSEQFTVEALFGRAGAKRIFNDVDKVVMLSGTLPPTDYLAKTLGVDPSDCERIVVPSYFPRQNRPFFYKPILRMNYGVRKQPDKLQVMTNAIDDVMELEPSAKGILHSVAYYWGQLYYELSRNRHRMLIHSAGTIEKTMVEFRNSPPGTWLVSPVATEGFNLPYDLCRYQVLHKVPFLPYNDELVNERRKYIPETAIVDTVTQVQQAYGRGMRYHDDSCRTYMFDSSWDSFYSNNARYFQLWFRDAIRNI